MEKVIKKKGRPFGSVKGSGNFTPQWREVAAKAAELNLSENAVLEMAGIVAATAQNWRYSFPKVGAKFLSTMSERGCTVEDMQAMGHEVPQCVLDLMKIWALP